MGIIKFKEIFWLSRKYWYIFLIFPLVIAGTIFFLTLNSPKIYDSSTVIYTGISSRKSADLTESLKIDFFTSSNLMDNIISLVNSRKSIEETSLKLLSYHLSLNGPDSNFLSSKKAEELKQHFTNDYLAKISVSGNPEQTYIKILRDLNENPQSTIRYLINNHPDYGINQIQQRVRVDRKKSSDMIEISFYADDPGICYQTVKILGEVYMLRYSELRFTETSSSVEYFESMLEKVFLKLQESEERLKQFIAENRIMNYYEQGKSLDLYKKEIEMAQNEALRNSLGAESSLIKLEEKLQSANFRNDIIDSLSQLRQEVSKLRLNLSTTLASGITESDEVLKTRAKINQLNYEINQKISNLYRQDYRVEGIPLTNILIEWLDLYIEKEKQSVGSEIALRSLNVVDDRIDIFAPLGADLKRLEREVGVNEREYLAVLNGLNQARLQKENLKISQTQEVIDPAYYPESPRTSKRKLLVVGGGLFGLIASLSIIIILILFDNSLKNIENAQRKSNLSVSSFLPEIKKSPEPLINKSLELFLNQLNIHYLNTYHNKPFIISLLCEKSSSQYIEIVFLLEKYSQLKGYKTLLVHNISNESHGRFYTLEEYKHKEASWVIFDYNFFTEEQFDLVFVLHPDLGTHNLSFDMLKKSHWILFMIDASDSWELWHQRMIEMISSGAGFKPEIFLMNVSGDESKDFLRS